MADLTRAEELVQSIDEDAAFQTAIKQAPTTTAKRAVLDARGFQDVGLEDMRAWVESKGGTLNIPESGKELSEQELAAVAGGLTADEEMAVAVVAVVAVAVVPAAASAAAA